MQNVVKMATSILKFIADAATLGLSTHNHARCLRFVSAFARYVVSSIGGQQNEFTAFEEEDLKDVIIFLKSSFSYASKLLHLVLTSSSESSASPREAFFLANDLDLIISIESSLGSRYASHVLSVAKPWLPVLILGLGSNQLIKAREEERRSNLGDFTALPLWLVVLSKAELYEFSKPSKEQDEEEGEESGDDIPQPEAPVFRKLTEMMVVLLKKGNVRVLDAAGGVLLTAAAFVLQGEEFGLVLGLLHFACMKLFGKEYSSWKELELVLRSLQEIYSRIERELGEGNLSEDGRRVLESSREMLGSVCVDPE